MTWRDLGKGLLVAGLAVAASALAAEGALRLVAGGDSRLARDLKGRDPRAIQIEPIGELGYRQKPGALVRYENGTVATANRLGYRGPEVTIPKPPGVFRIALLGGSTAHGWGVNDDGTMDAWLRRELRARRPDLAVEVVNLAFDGYDSYQLYERLREDGPRLSPDVVIVHEGINDVRNATFSNLTDKDPRTLIWRAELGRLRAEQRRGRPRLWDTVKHYSYLARLAAAGRGVVRQRRERTPRTQPNLEAARYFELNLRRIAGLADSLGAPLILSGAPSSLGLGFPDSARVRRSYFLADNAATQAFRDTLAGRMSSVAAALSAAGQRAAYLSHPDVPPGEFIDDAHLTPEGNHRVARRFAAALLPLLPPPGSAAPAGSRAAAVR